jgi:hypothetical protein
MEVMRMFPMSLLEDRITWDEYVKRRRWSAEHAFEVYHAIKFMFGYKHQELPDGVAYFSEKGWSETVKSAIKLWNELVCPTFDGWA